MTNLDTTKCFILCLIIKILHLVHKNLSSATDMIIDSGCENIKKLDLTILAVLLCTLGLVIYFVPIVAVAALLYASYIIIRPMIGEMKDESFDELAINNSGNRK